MISGRTGWSTSRQRPLATAAIRTGPRRSLSECQPSPFSLSSLLMALDRRQEKMIMDRVGGQMCARSPGGPVQ
jgi:hypothetical protein